MEASGIRVAAGEGGNCIEYGSDGDGEATGKAAADRCERRGIPIDRAQGRRAREMKLAPSEVEPERQSQIKKSGAYTGREGSESQLALRPRRTKPRANRPEARSARLAGSGAPTVEVFRSIPSAGMPGVSIAVQPSTPESASL